MASDIALADAAEWLRPTQYIESEHPTIKEKAKALTEGLSDGSDQAKAAALHDFVRDDIVFGFTGDFYNQTASKVLAAGKGFCQTKATLFTALLRAVGIPARVYFVSISADILRGYNIPGPFVDHCFTEVFLEDRWVRVDSYTVDKPMADKAQALLEQEGAALGYGVHSEGTSYWNGREDAFVQWVVKDKPDKHFSDRDYGVFRDVADFYQRAQGVDNKQNFVSRIVMRPFLFAADLAVRKFRNA